MVLKDCCISDQAAKLSYPQKLRAVSGLTVDMTVFVKKVRKLLSIMLKHIPADLN